MSELAQLKSSLGGRGVRQNEELTLGRLNLKRRFRGLRFPPLRLRIGHQQLEFLVQRRCVAGYVGSLTASSRFGGQRWKGPMSVVGLGGVPERGRFTVRLASARPHAPF